MEQRQGENEAFKLNDGTALPTYLEIIFSPLTWIILLGLAICSYILVVGIPNRKPRIPGANIRDKREKEAYNKVLIATYSHIYINSDVHIVTA